MHPPKRMIGIGHCQAIAEWGPGRRVKVPGEKVSKEALGAALRRAQCKLLFPIAVGFINNQLPIGRPRRVVLIHSRCVRQVLRLGIWPKAEKIAPGGHYERLSLRRDGIIDPTHDVGESYELPYHDGARACALVLVRNVYFDLTKLFGRKIDRKKMAALLKRDGRTAERWPVDVVVEEVRDLAERSANKIKAPDVLAEVATAV